MRTSALAATLLAGAIVRCALLPVPGTADVDSWKIWAYEGSKDPTALYGVGGFPIERRRLSWNGMTGTTEYPPLGLYEIAAAGRIYRSIDPSFSDSPTLTVLIKIPGLLAETAFVAAILTWGRRRLGHQVAAWIAIAVWLNPMVIVNGSGLGYLDAQMALPAVLAILAAAFGQPFLAGTLITAAVLTKAQALFVAPVVVLAALHGDFTHGRRAALRMAAGGALTAAAVVGPILVRGAWPNMLQAVGRLAAHNIVSGNNLNVWWIVTWIVRALDSLDLGWRTAFTLRVRLLEISRFMAVGYPDPKPIGTLVVLLAILWALWTKRRDQSIAARGLLAGWCVYAYSMFGVQVHENHAYLAVPCLALAAGMNKTLRPLFWAVSAMVAFNMYVFYGVGTWAFPVVHRDVTVVDLTVIAAFLNVGLFGWMTHRLVRVPGAGFSVPASPPRTPSL